MVQKFIYEISEAAALALYKSQSNYSIATAITAVERSNGELIPNVGNSPTAWYKIRKHFTTGEHINNLLT